MPYKTPGFIYDEKSRKLFHIYIDEDGEEQTEFVCEGMDIPHILRDVDCSDLYLVLSYTYRKREIDNKNGVKYLRHSKGKGETCTNSVLMDDVEKKVIQKVINKIYSKENIGYFVNNFSQISRRQSIQVKDKVDTLNRRIKSYKAKYDNLIESLSTITDKAIVGDIEDKLKDNQTCIQALQKELKELKRGIPRKPSEEEVLKSKIKLKRYMKNPQNIIPTSQLLRDMIEGVYIHDGNIKIKFNM